MRIGGGGGGADVQDSGSCTRTLDQEDYYLLLIGLGTAKNKVPQYTAVYSRVPQQY